jgi:hypothetical protein
MTHEMRQHGETLYLCSIRCYAWTDAHKVGIVHRRCCAKKDDGTTSQPVQLEKPCLLFLMKGTLQESRLQE